MLKMPLSQYAYSSYEKSTASNVHPIVDKGPIYPKIFILVTVKLVYCDVWQLFVFPLSIHLPFFLQNSYFEIYYFGSIVVSLSSILL